MDGWNLYNVVIKRPSLKKKKPKSWISLVVQQLRNPPANVGDTGSIPQVQEDSTCLGTTKPMCYSD